MVSCVGARSGGCDDCCAGVKQWVREDGLGTIANLQFLDMPADQPAEVESFLEKTRAEVNPIKLAFLRWQLQAQLFKVSLPSNPFAPPPPWEPG